MAAAISMPFVVTDASRKITIGVVASARPAAGHSVRRRMTAHQAAPVNNRRLIAAAVRRAA
jgi:hypothetical protein